MYNHKAGLYQGFLLFMIFGTSIFLVPRNEIFGNKIGGSSQILIIVNHPHFRLIPYYSNRYYHYCEMIL